MSGRHSAGRTTWPRVFLGQGLAAGGQSLPAPRPGNTCSNHLATAGHPETLPAVMTMIAAILLALMGVASARPRGLARDQMRNAIFKNTEDIFQDILDNDTGFKAQEESNEIGWTRNGDLVKSISEDYYVDYYFYEDPVINIKFKRSIGDNLSSSEQEETVAPRSEERRANAHPSATRSGSERRRNRALRKMLRRNRKLRKSSRRNRKVMSNRT